MGVLVGKDCAVKIGTATVQLMGAWSMDGISTDEFDVSALGDEWKNYAYGMKDAGTLSFNGWYDPTDVTGQQALMEANLYNSSLTNVRLYINDTSYLEPCQTTGYFSPSLTTGAPSEVAAIKVTGFSVAADKANVMTVNFSCRIINGPMVLV